MNENEEMPSCGAFMGAWLFSFACFAGLIWCVTPDGADLPWKSWAFWAIAAPLSFVAACIVTCPIDDDDDDEDRIERLEKRISELESRK